MKSGYLKVLFVGLPFGLGCLITGIKDFIELPKSINYLVLEEGDIQTYGVKTIYDSGAKTDFKVFYIKISESEYYAALKSQKEVLRKQLPHYLRETKHISLWHEKGRKYIKQISVGENILYEYKPPYWMAHFFFWIGLITLVSGVGYLILHPEDLTGKKRKGKVSKW